MMRPKGYFRAALSIYLALGAGAWAQAEGKYSDSVRVLLWDNAASAKLFITGPYAITDLDTGKVVKAGERISSEVRCERDGIYISNMKCAASAARVEPKRDATLFVNNRCFRDVVDFVKSEASGMLVINTVDVDSYLYGVLYNEVSPLWPIEALKAQAIAARTFALYERSRRRGSRYDLRSDIYSQVYGGKISESLMTNRAVDLTMGEVLVFRGELIPAYYHATCAGHTEDASRLWAIDLPPLKGVECPYCRHSPHYRWRRTASLDFIEKRMKAAGHAINGISSIEATSRDDSGRIEKLSVKGPSGASASITAKDFRQIMDPNFIMSANFEVDIKGGEAVFKGLGWGHGVGMCQWGAFGMAKSGLSAAQILGHYYPGSEIVSISKGAG